MGVEGDVAHRNQNSQSCPWGDHHQKFNQHRRIGFLIQEQKITIFS